MENDISQITTYESGVMQSTAHRILGRIKTDFLNQFNLTSMQWFVIGFAYDAGDAGIRLSELMQKLDTTMPFITTTINTLEAKNIIHKISDTNDSRVKIAVLNKTYRRTAKEIEEGLREELRAQLYREDNVSRAELSAYINVLYKIAQSNK